MNNMKYLKSFIFIILISFIGSITAMRVSAHNSNLGIEGNNDITYDPCDPVDYVQKVAKSKIKKNQHAIAPDYSEVGDINRIENIYRLFKSRIVSVWLTLECNIIVIPNITYANENYFDVMLDGMEDTEVVSFSVKGVSTNIDEKVLFEKAIKYTVDNLKHLKKIIVYSVSTDDEKIFNMFKYASLKGIEIVIPNNILRERNIHFKEVNSNGKD